jgi:hypothetical protein
MDQLAFVRRSLNRFAKTYGEVVRYCSLQYAERRKEEAHEIMTRESTNPKAERARLCQEYLDWGTIVTLVQKKEKEEDPLLSDFAKEYKIARQKFYEAEADGKKKTAEDCQVKMDEILYNATITERKEIEIHVLEDLTVL